MANIQVKVPDIGDFDEVAVIEILVSVGDTVSVEQSLITVESDKASMEIPSSHAGVVKSVAVKVGDKVREGSVVIELDAQDATASVEQAAQASSAAPAAQVLAAQAAPEPAPSVAAGEVDIVVPDIGDFKDVAVIELLVAIGDTVAAEQSLITVESDKASMEIPAAAAGQVTALKVKVGDTVNQGDVIGSMRVQGAAPVASAAAQPSASANTAQSAQAAAPVAPALAAPAAASAEPAHQPGVESVKNLPYASPSIRKFARELGVPLEQVKGSASNGRITRADIEQFTRAVMSGATQTAAQQASSSGNTGGDGAALGLIPWPKVDFAKFGPIERKELGRIKKISGANLLRNAIMIPAVTNHDDADITDLEAFRVLTNKENEKSGVKVTMLAFLIKACVAALKKYPEFNSSLDGDALIYKNYWHIGFAADTPNGLMVPVIRDCDKKGVLQISQEMSELAKKARDGKLGPAEMTGATFTISSLGGIGGRYFTPIINAPEVAILGVCRSTMEPVWDGKAFQPRLMLPLSLTWDHRVIDGAAAARFNAYLGQILSDFRRVLL